MTEEMSDGFEEVEEEEESDDVGLDDLFHEIYVEIATSLIYEVQLFDTYVLARLASPNMFAAIMKINHVDFARDFQEYAGDPEEVRQYLRGAAAKLIIE